MKQTCGVCGKRIPAKSKTNWMGYGTCKDCQKIINKERNDMKKNYGLDVDDLGGGLMVVRM